MTNQNLQITEHFGREAFWLGEGDSALLTWLFLPTQHTKFELGFVLCPPLGHEYVHTYRTYRKLAEFLASMGVPDIKFDLLGAGNSSGDALDPNRLNSWQENINSQIAYLKNKLSVKHVGLFGVRMGATLAMQACASQTIKNLIVWNPIRKGKQYARELSALSKFSASSEESRQAFIESGGFVISQETLSDLNKLEFSQAAPLVVENLLAIVDGISSDEKLKKLFSVNVNYEQFNTQSYAAMMEEPQHAEIPLDVIEKIGLWICQTNNLKKINKNSIAKSAVPALFGNEKASVIRANKIKETLLFVNKNLFAILSEPGSAVENKNTIVVFGNSGAVHTVGPNRLYLEISRGLVAQGYSTLRLDLHNIGDSVFGVVEKDNFPYPKEEKAVNDIFAAVSELKQKYPSARIVLAGVCSGAYWAFRSAVRANKNLIDSVIIINPLTFDWTETSVLEDPTDQDVMRNKIHYMNAAKSKDKWIKLLKGQVDFKKIAVSAFKIIGLKIKGAIISALEISNLLPAKKLALDLAQVKDKNIGIDFVFSSLDPGYDLLTMAGGARVKRMMKKNEFSVSFIRDADHTFSKSIHRKELLEKLLERLSKPLLKQRVSG